MLEYLKSHILEEIDGAIDYAEKAVEMKNTPYGSKFMTMSDMEAEHANCLLKMFNHMEKPSDLDDSKYAAMNKSILDKYATSMGKLEWLKKLYLA